MKIKDRDHARELISSAGITTSNITKRQLKALWLRLSTKLIESENYRGTYEMNGPTGTKFMTCRTDQWSSREAISFNRDGFIGFAGWADDSNVRPILDAVGAWLTEPGALDA